MTLENMQQQTLSSPLAGRAFLADAAARLSATPAVFAAVADHQRGATMPKFAREWEMNYRWPKCEANPTLLPQFTRALAGRVAGG